MCRTNRTTKEQLELVERQIREYFEIQERLWDEHHSESMWSKVCNYIRKFF